MRNIITSAALLLLQLTGIAQNQLTNLPTLYITTEGGQPIVVKETWLNGSLNVVADDHVPGRYNGPIEIRGRGNSTWFPDKKPYRIRLPRGSNFQLLGLPSNARNWVLLANFFDQTLIRNALAFELSNLLNFEYTPPYRLVDVVLNGNYVGNYTLTDHIQVENYRVQVEELNPEDTDPSVISGGYFIQEDLYAIYEAGHFQTSRVKNYEIKYPDAEDINTEQRAFVTNFLQDFENRLFSPDFLDAELGYNAVVDRTSQVNWQIVNELTANQDAYLSIYHTKKRNDPKLYFGPMWDYDRGFDNSDRHTDMAYLAMPETLMNTDKISRMLLDPGFVNALRDRWKALRQNGIYETLDSKITELASIIQQSQEQNFQLPNITNSPISPPAYQDRIALLRRYLKRKTGFLDYYFTRELNQGRFYKIGDITQRSILSPTENTEFRLLTDHDNNLMQEWSFIPAGTENPGYFTIRNRQNNLLLTQSNNNLLLASEQPANPYPQLWKIEQIPNQSYAAILTHPQAGEQKALARSGSTEITLTTNIGTLETSTSRRWFFVASDIGESPLPVTISSFHVENQEGVISVNWTMTEATNFSHFEIERTSDPSNITPKMIGTISPGNQIEGVFRFPDNAPEPGLNYYRLKLVDTDGSYTFTSYKAISYSGIADLRIFPIPTPGELTISFESRMYSGDACVTLHNNLGRKMLSKNIVVRKGLNNTWLNVQTLSAGIYHLQLETGSQVQNRRIIINR